MRSRYNNSVGLRGGFASQYRGNPDVTVPQSLVINLALMVEPLRIESILRRGSVRTKSTRQLNLKPNLTKSSLIACPASLSCHQANTPSQSLGQ